MRNKRIIGIVLVIVGEDVRTRVGFDRERDGDIYATCFALVKVRLSSPATSVRTRRSTVPTPAMCIHRQPGSTSHRPSPITRITTAPCA